MENTKLKKKKRKNKKKKIKSNNFEIRQITFSECCKFIIFLLILFIIIKDKNNKYKITEIKTKDEENFKEEKKFEKEDYEKEDDEKEKEEFLIEKYIDTNKNITDLFDSYYKKCQNKTLFNKKKFFLSKKPKITVIMPVYNKENDLYYSIRSIQNQQMKKIEIIIINDASTDKTLKTIEKLKEEDPRIKIINNEKNRRILYSKSIGALFANGKYILELDQDDMFISEYVFSNLYYEAEKNNYDLIQFRDFCKNDNYENGTRSAGMIFPRETKVETQPNIKKEMFKKYNYLLWGLLIKADLYKKTVIHLWPYIINYKIIHFEDYTITFFFAIFANKFKYLNNFYIAHLYHNNSVTSNQELQKQFHDGILLFFNFMFEYHVKNNPKDIIIFKNLIFLTKRIFLNLPKKSPNLFEFVFTKILDYFSEGLRRILRYNIKLLNTFHYSIEKKEYKTILNFQNLINNNNTIGYKRHNIKPKISIIIYFNYKTFIKRTINSILNQQIFEDYEIIIVYDSNYQYGLNSISDLIKGYKNILIIDNKMEKGLFYSYYEGVKQSKGDYILTMNAGYAFAKNNSLNDIYQNIGKNTDILEFNLLINNNENSLKIYRCSHFNSTINLDHLKFNKEYKQIDQEKELMINKLVKSTIYKNIMNKYSSFFKKMKNYYYDEIITFLIEQQNITVKHIEILGIIEFSKWQWQWQDNFIYQMNTTNKDLIDDSINYINFLFSYNKDNKDFALNEFYNIMNIIYNKYNIITNEGKDLMYTFLNCRYISKYKKNNLITYFNALINRTRYFELDYIN